MSVIAQFLLIILITLIISFSIKRVLSLYLLSRLGLQQGTRESIPTITSYASGTLLCIVLLQFAGINLASVAVLAGSLGIGIGFGLQDITKEFISGLALLVERKLKVGDFVELNDLSGYITEISLRSTVIRTLTQKHIVVPNSRLVSNQVINWTYSNTKGWVSMLVSVTHESDPLLVIEVLMDSAYLEESVSLEHPPEVYFTAIRENALDFKLWVWSNQIDTKFMMESSLNYIILQNLKQHGIRLAAPRLDLWNRTPDLAIAQTSSAHENNLDALPKPIAIRNLLKQLPFFKNCTEIELRKLVEIGHRKRLEPFETLYQEGDPGDAFYIILCGAVGYTLESTDANPGQATIMRTGQFVGEFSLMLNVPRTVTVRAVEETTLFSISPKGFKKLLRDQPHLYDVIVEEMARHEEELSQQGRQLRKLGLINSDDYNLNPVEWIRKRLEGLFGL